MNVSVQLAGLCSLPMVPVAIIYQKVKVGTSLGISTTIITHVSVSELHL